MDTLSSGLHHVWEDGGLDVLGSRASDHLLLFLCWEATLPCAPQRCLGALPMLHILWAGAPIVFDSGLSFQRCVLVNSLGGWTSCFSLLSKSRRAVWYHRDDFSLWAGLLEVILKEWGLLNSRFLKSVSHSVVFNSLWPPWMVTLQARILEWVAISFFRGSSCPRNWTQVSYIGRWFLYHWTMKKALFKIIFAQFMPNIIWAISFSEDIIQFYENNLETLVFYLFYSSILLFQ